MYNVSEAYKEAIKASSRICSVKGVIKTTGGASIEITDKDISSGTFYINNQCVSESDFAFGAVFVGELGISLITDIDRYSFYGAEIKLSYFLELVDGQLEEVPLGVYYVESSERDNRYVTIQAYDCMTNLDNELEFDTNGSIYDILQLVSRECKVTLAQDERAIKDLVNGNTSLSIYADKTPTYRDVVSAIASLTASFATINREGKLEFRQFSKGVSLDIERDNRVSTKMSDFITVYDGLKIKFIGKGKYKAKRKTSVNGLTLEMGSIPLIEGKKEEKQKIANDIFEVLSDVKYTPYSIEMNGNPAIDLGDKIVIKNVDGKDEDIESIVTHIDWHYREKSSIQAVGGNPKMRNIKPSDAGNSYEELESKIAEKDFVVKNYSNSKEYEVNGIEQDIITIQFIAVANIRPTFLATIPIEMDLDGNVVISYYLDEKLLNTSTLVGYYERGSHIITITNNFKVKKDEKKTLTVKIKAEYFPSDVRLNKANINSLTGYAMGGIYNPPAVDTTPPKGTIAKYSIKAILFAQGILASKGKEFYGNLDFDEKISGIKIKPFIIELSDSIKHAEVHPANNDINESISGVDFNDFDVLLNENLGIER
nr:MAG TPA: Minor structural protein [Caudoviricetes sp.]